MQGVLDELTLPGDGLRLHAVAAGPENGPAAILLHGFPEFWYGWRKQIPALAAAGFRVIVPDQRGYNTSDKPRGVPAYGILHLIADVIALADHLRRDRFYLAGHDWGAAVAWGVALRHPERLHRLAILNVPHPAVMFRYLTTSPRQMLRSWYMLFFQIPRLTEILFSANHFRIGVSSLLRSSRPGTFTAADIARYRDAWAQPGAVTGMLNWYRALFRTPAEAVGRDPAVRVPTRILWGARDRFLLAVMARESVRYCASAGLVEFPDATHWLQHEEPEGVNESLIEFFR